MSAVTKTFVIKELPQEKICPFNNKDIIIRDCAEIENSAKGGPIAFADYYILTMAI